MASSPAEACTDDDADGPPIISVSYFEPRNGLEPQPSNDHAALTDWTRVVVSDDGATGNVTSAAIQGGESIGLRYLRDVVSDEEARRAVALCDARDGWTASPSREYKNEAATAGQENGAQGGTRVRGSRTSSSCPLIWPLLYLPRLDSLRAAGKVTAAIENELDVAWTLTQRFASLLGVDEARIEPLQLVRYEPGQFYRPHHDHGAYYGAPTERRSSTLLVFLSSMPPADGGGHTSFPDLGIRVLPRRGDGLLWRNVDERTGDPLTAAVHEAIAPRNVVAASDENNNNNPDFSRQQEDTLANRKFAMNVWVADEPIQLVPNAAAYRTQ